jgi:hypothetical protein
MKAFSAFLRGVAKGTIELGFAAMPMVQLYNRARAAGTPFLDLLVADPDTAFELVGALKKQARRLPKSVLAAIAQIAAEAAAEGPPEPAAARRSADPDDV